VTSAPSAPPARRLCRLEEFEDGEAKEFLFGEGPAQRALFVLREGGEIYGYENACPHIGTPLNFLPDQFLSTDGSYILCSTHGALFQIEDGLCVAGPCQGEKLTEIKVALDEEGYVLLTDPDFPAA